ncbi:MAG: SUMF1/EgtB/PvdO family nonheme iron enzyme [Acidobacteriota bacterium]
MAAIDVFISYSHRDEELLEELRAHLSPLVREGLVNTWHDRMIRPGVRWKDELDHRLERSEVILLLVSAYFISSDYCYELEMSRALERHHTGGAIAVPIILRACDWKSLPFGEIQALPTDIEPVTSWQDIHAAFHNVVNGLREVIARRRNQQEPTKLDQAYEERALLLQASQDTTHIDSQIRDVKRRIREGGRLSSGDFLGDRFKLHELLGQGGFGQVWKAYDQKLREFVAVKVLHPRYGRDETRRARFFRGARQMHELREEPGIVDVIELECHDGGFHFFVMEYLQGGDFRQAVLSGRLGRDEKLRIVLKIGEALEAAHARKIVHRDVKPANILLDADGQPKLTDFDLVRAADTTGGTKTGKMGTFIYAAPEAMMGAREASGPADVYGLGMTAIFAIYGSELPPDIVFDQSVFFEGLRSEKRTLDALSAAIAYRSEERIQTMRELRRVVAQCLGSPSAEIVPRLREDRAPRAEPPSYPEPGELWIEPVLGMRARFVPPGAFVMGSPEDEEGRRANEIQHRVVLTDGFWLGETPVTQGQWRRIMKPVPGAASREAESSCPVVNVSWFEAVDFLNRLSEKSGFMRVFDANDLATWRSLYLNVQRAGILGFRLPSEAEWEFAARAGTITARYSDEVQVSLAEDSELESVAWFRENSRGKVRPVGQLRPNAWGLSDMLGNVWEWCWDRAGVVGSSEPTINPEGPAAGSERVIRGGSWSAHARFVRAASRGWDPADARGPNLGFRWSLGHGAAVGK